MARPSLVRAMSRNRVTLDLSPHLARVMADKLIQYARNVENNPDPRAVANFYPANNSPFPLTVRIKAP